MTEIGQEHQGTGDNVGNNNQTNNHSAPTGMNGIQAENVDVNFTQHFHNNQAQSQKKIPFKLAIEEDDISPEKAEEYLKFILEAIKKRRNIEQCYITIEFIAKGSTEFILDGSQEDLQCLAELQESGELQKLLNELKPDHIPKIIVKKAEFTEDPLIIKKVQLIKSIKEKTIEKRSFPIKADLSGVYLIRADLRGANLRGANLSRADLIRANLSGADLIRANLSRTDLSRTDLSGAYLSGAYLSGAYLSRAYLSRAYLNEADLRGAYLSRADLNEANLRGADLRGADLRGADLTGADLNEADLRGVDLNEAYLTGANLNEAYLRGANLRGADLTGANLNEAYLRGANLRGADLIRAVLRKAKYNILKIFAQRLSPKHIKYFFRFLFILFLFVILFFAFYR